MDPKNHEGLTLDQWADAHCPELGKKLTAIVAEWNLSDADQDRCVVLLLQTVRENVG